MQVETLAHFGVVFLLFVLGIEFSAAKVKAVKAVAVGGGTLIIAGSMLAGMGVAVLLSAPLTQVRAARQLPPPLRHMLIWPGSGQTGECSLGSEDHLRGSPPGGAQRQRENWVIVAG